MKKTDRLTTVLALVLFLTFAAYAGAFAYRTVNDRTVTAQAVLASVTEGGAASGIVVRRETVLTSDEPYIDLRVAEGAKVASGGTVAMAINSPTGLARAERVRELELEIERVSALLEQSERRRDLTRRDTGLREAVLQLAGAVSRQEYVRLEGAAANVRALVFTGGEAAGEQELEALRAELSSLLTSTSRDTAVLTAGTGGVFSSLVDGWEHLTPPALEGLNPAALQALTASRMERPAGAYGKLVTDYDWYFAAVMDAGDARQLSAGAYATLDFGKFYSEGVPAFVVSVSPPEDGAVAVVFRCSTALAETLSMRETTASVICRQYEGLRLPAQALRDDGDGAGPYVWVITAMQLEKKRVELLYEGEGFCLVRRESRADALREGNEIVVSGTDLSEGKLMI